MIIKKGVYVSSTPPVHMDYGLSPKAAAYIKHHIRQSWRYYSLSRREAVDKPCIECGAPPPSKADHIEPVVNPEVGFEGYDDHVKRMFYGKLQPLCKVCHDKKSAEEAHYRKKVRAAKKAAAKEATNGVV